MIYIVDKYKEIMIIKSTCMFIFLKNAANWLEYGGDEEASSSLNNAFDYHNLEEQNDQYQSLSKNFK